MCKSFRIRQTKGIEYALEASPAYISTGRLPAPHVIKKLVTGAYKRFESDKQGRNSQVYPALARVPTGLFGICVVDTIGNIYSAGERAI